MLQSDRGVFIEYPKEWIQKLPFDSWSVPGIIVLILFGIGNLVAGLSVFSKKEGALRLITGLMGSLLLLCLLFQYIILGEWYLPDLYFFVIGLIQLFLGLYLFMKRVNNLGGNL